MDGAKTPIQSGWAESGQHREATASDCRGASPQSTHAWPGPCQVGLSHKQPWRSPRRTLSAAAPGASAPVACTMKLYENYKGWVRRNNVALNLFETGACLAERRAGAGRRPARGSGRSAAPDDAAEAVVCLCACCLCLGNGTREWEVEGSSRPCGDVLYARGPVLPIGAWELFPSGMVPAPLRVASAPIRARMDLEYYVLIMGAASCQNWAQWFCSLESAA